MNIGTDKQPEQVHVLSDIGFTVTTQKNMSDGSLISCDFRIYEHLAWAQNPQTGVFDVPQYEIKGSTCGDTTPDISLSWPIIELTIKWDGCSHWYFGNDKGAYIHICGRETMNKYIKVMEWCWDFLKDELDD